jgi:hypothetical protein
MRFCNVLKRQIGKVVTILAKVVCIIPYLVVEDETRSSNVQIVHDNRHLVIDGVATYQAMGSNKKENVKTKNSLGQHFGLSGIL